MEAVISIKSKSDPKYALKSFLALKMGECCNVVEDDVFDCEYDNDDVDKIESAPALGFKNRGEASSDRSPTW